MLKYQFSFSRKLNITIDALTAALAYYISFLSLNYLQTGYPALSEPHRDHLVLAFVVLILWPLLLILNGIYPTDRLRTIKRASMIIVKAGIQGLVILMALVFTLRLEAISRLGLIVFMPAATVFLIVKEGIAIWYFHFLRQSGRNLRNVIVAGSLNNAGDIAGKIEENAFLGLRVLGLLLPEHDMPGNKCDHKVLGSLRDIEKVLHDHPIDHVIIAIDRDDFNEIDRITEKCEEEGVEIWLNARLFSIGIAKLDSDELLGMPLFVFRTVPQYSWQIFIKNTSDILIGALAVVLTLPLIAVAAVFIKANSKGPVLFKQERVGLQGRRFILYKLRTMYAGSHEVVKQFEKENVMKGPAFKIINDPRVTSVGRFLRRTSIDELPQLWNVLKGEMSLVGPRPPLPEEVKQYQGWQRRRLSMKPGISGLWQVSGRDKITDFDKWAELDLKYIDNWSLMLDLRILAKTALVVLTGDGAH